MTTQNREETEQTPRRGAKRTRGEPKLYISFLPEGRGGPREDKGSVPLEVDVEAHIEERTDCEPGLYRIEKKRSGEFSGEVLFYSKDDESEPSASAHGDVDVDLDLVPPGDADVRSIVASTVNAVLDARERRERATAGQPDPMQQFREMRELLKEERESGSPAQQDPIAMFERLVELQKKLTPEAPEPADSLSAKDRAQLMLVKETGIIPEFMRSMREMLRAPEDSAEPKGFVDKALDYLKDWTPFVGPAVAPMLGQKVSELLSRVNVDAIAERMNRQAGSPSVAAESLPAAAHSGPSTSQADFMKSIEVQLLDALAVVVECMTLDTDDSDGVEHVERAAKAIQVFSQNNPAVAQPILSGLFAESSDALIAQLASQKPEWAYVAKLGHASDFVDRLKDALSPDEETETEKPSDPKPTSEVSRVTPSVNGSKAAASVDA